MNNNISMKFKVFALAVIAAFTFSGFSGQAQGLKIAYVNSGELLDTLPVIDTIQMKIQSVSTSWQNRLTSFQNEMQRLMQYNDANPTNDTEILAYRQEQLQSIQSKIQETYQKAQQDVQAKEQEMLQPVLKRVKEVITEVAKAKGYDYVLDSNEGGSFIYGADKFNLMADVIAKLNTEDLVSLIN